MHVLIYKQEKVVRTDLSIGRIIARNQSIRQHINAVKSLSY